MLGLVGQLVVGVERPGRGRQVAGQHLTDDRDLVAAGGRAGDDVRPVAELVDGDEVLGEPLLVDRVRLRRQRHDRCALAPPQLGELAGDELVARADPLVRGQAETDDVDLEQRLAHEVVEALPQQRAWFVQPGRVDEDQLAVLPRHDAADRVPGGLRLARRDGDLGADERVGQGRLAGVGPPDQAREPGDVRLLALGGVLVHPARSSISGASAAGSTRSTITVAMR
jgi:hypothetical protein